MAQSQNFGTGNQYVVFYMVATQNSQDEIANTSNVTCDFYLKRTNTGYTTTGTFNCTMVINGTSYTNSWYGSFGNVAVKVFSQTVTIPHNSDGTKTLSMSASMTGYYSGSGGSWTMPLTTIPRTSNFSTSSSANAGGSISINIDRAATSFTHDLYLKVGDGTWLIAKGVATSVSNWTIPNEVMNKITTSTSGIGIIDCYTLNGSALIGSISKNITINIPSTVVPALSSISLERVDNGVPSDWGVYVKGKSKVKYTINGASGSYGSWITSYKVTGSGGTWSYQSTTTNELWATGMQTFTVTITDSRGRTATKNNNITIYDYWNPTIGSFSAKRCDSDGTLNEDGQYSLVQLNYSFATVNGKNVGYGKVFYRKKGNTAWSSEVSLSNGVAKIIGSNDISNNNTYELLLRAGDSFTYIDRVIELPSSKVIMDFRNGGNGIAIGKVSEKDGLEIDWATYFNQQAQFTNQIVSNRQGDGVTLLKFNTDRQWEFQQGGTGSTASLDLVSLVDSKKFRVTTPDKSKMIEMSVGAAGSNMYVDGNNVWHGGNCTSGSGINQQWWRYDNGLQIVRQWKTLGTINIASAWGNLYTQGGAQTGFDPYAVLFKTPPQTAFSVYGDGSMFILNSQKSTTSWCGSYELARGSSVTGLTNVTVQCISIGEWK